MAYSVAADIESEFKNIDFDAATAIVTTAQVTAWIAEADALINSYIGVRYVVPVASGEALTLMRMFSRLLVAERVRKVLEVKQGTNKDADQNPRGALSSKDILMQLKRIADGLTKLDGFTDLSSTGGFSSYNRTYNVVPEFTKDDKAW